MREKTNLTSSLLENTGKQDRLNEATEKIIGCAYKVANKLGCGFLEKVYENALAYEICKSGLEVEQQKSLKVYYENIQVGRYAPDLLVGGLVIVELKTVNRLENNHRAQCLNYLNATGLKICLLINSGNPKVEVKRIAL